MEKIYNDCNIPDNGLWIRLVILTLINQKTRWWRIFKKNNKVEKMTWEGFTKVFYKHHFTEANQAALD